MGFGEFVEVFCKCFVQVNELTEVHQRMENTMKTQFTVHIQISIQLDVKHFFYSGHLSVYAFCIALRDFGDSSSSMCVLGAKLGAGMLSFVSA